MPRGAASTGPIARAACTTASTTTRARRSSTRPGAASPAPGFDESGWARRPGRERVVVPEARVSPFVRRLEELPVCEVITTPAGKTVLDFGQNLVGRLRIAVDGPGRHRDRLRHAEVLEHGELGTRPLRAGRGDRPLTLAGDGERSGSRSSRSTASATPRSRAGRGVRPGRR